MLKRLFSATFLLAITAMAIPAIASAKENKPPVAANKVNVVSFELANHLIVVKTKINNSSKDYNFAVDTGSGICILNKGVPAEIGLKPVGQTNTTDTSNTTAALSQYQLDSISVDNNVVKNTPVLEVDLTGMSAVAGRKIDGIIGDSFLRPFCICIDYKKKQLIFTKSEPSIPGKYIIKTQERPQFVTLSVPMTINGAAIEGFIDTGSSSFVVPVSFLEKLNISKEDRINIKGSMSDTLFSSQSATKDMLLRIKSLEIGKFKLNNYPVNSYGGDAILLGYSFLSQFRITIDYPRNTVMLTPYESASFPDNVTNFGMTLGTNANRELIIASVYEGSFADKQGASVGDAVLKINGKSLSEYTPADLAKIFGDTTVKEIDLVVRHDGKEMPIKVKRDPQFSPKSN